jgi:phosphoglycolate phosphatase-like HAD superfamily hydrolase
VTTILPEGELGGQLVQFFIETVGAPPDKATGLGQLLVRQGHAAKHTVMIGDSYNDYRAARSNGTRFIGVAAEPHQSPFPADTVVINDLSQLEEALLSLE